MPLGNRVMMFDRCSRCGWPQPSRQPDDKPTARTIKITADVRTAHRSFPSPTLSFDQLARSSLAACSAAKRGGGGERMRARREHLSSMARTLASPQFSCAAHDRASFHAAWPRISAARRGRRSRRCATDRSAGRRRCRPTCSGYERVRRGRNPAARSCNAERSRDASGIVLVIGAAQPRGRAHVQQRHASSMRMGASRARPTSISYGTSIANGSRPANASNRYAPASARSACWSARTAAFRTIASTLVDRGCRDPGDADRLGDERPRSRESRKRAGRSARARARARKSRTVRRGEQMRRRTGLRSVLRQESDRRRDGTIGGARVRRCGTKRSSRKLRSDPTPSAAAVHRCGSCAAFRRTRPAPHCDSGVDFGDEPLLKNDCAYSKRNCWKPESTILARAIQHGDGVRRRQSFWIRRRLAGIPNRRACDVWCGTRRTNRIGRSDLHARARLELRMYVVVIEARANAPSRSIPTARSYAARSATTTSRVSRTIPHAPANRRCAGDGRARAGLERAAAHAR